MYGGEEVAALVVDVGADTTKAGYAGEDTPKCVFATAAGCTAGAEGRAYTDELHFPGPGLEIVSPFTDGLITDWEAYEQVLAHALTKRLRVTSLEHPVLLAEPLGMPPAARERLVQLLFEKYSPPALFLAKHPVLSSFAVGRPTSLVIDCGASGTVVSAVHDGYSLGKTVHRSPLGGAALTELLQASLAARSAEVRPRFSFKRALRPGGDYAVTPVTLPGVTSSYTEWRRREVVADVKETCCRLLEGPFREADAAAFPSAPYELPDGTLLEVGLERFQIPELLFNPALLATLPAPMDSRLADLAASAASLKGLPAAVADVLSRCDVDLRRELLSGVVLTGGGSLLPTLKERLERQLAAEAPQVGRVKLLASASTPERKYGVWLGGSILASLGSFQQLWMSRAEYDEQGAAHVHRKCP